jgi:hypothetical protein
MVTNNNHMFWDEVQEPDQIKGRPSQLGLWSKFPHSPKISTNLHQTEKGWKSQNDLNFHSILHSHLDALE